MFFTCNTTKYIKITTQNQVTILFLEDRTNLQKSVVAFLTKKAISHNGQLFSYHKIHIRKDKKIQDFFKTAKLNLIHFEPDA